MVTLSAATVTSYVLYTFFEPAGPGSAIDVHGSRSSYTGVFGR